jgi:hypothetical protein
MRDTNRSEKPSFDGAQAWVLPPKNEAGWLSLGRGFEKLLFLQAGWNAAAAYFSLEDPINP